MKKIILIILLISFSAVFSQEYQSFLKNDGIKLKKGVISDQLILKVSQNEVGFYKVTIESFKESNKSVSFQIKPFSYALFETKLINSFTELKQKELVPDLYDKTDTNNKVMMTELYAEIASYFHTANERPKVATINLKSEEIDVYAPVKHRKSKNQKKKFSKKVGSLKNPVVEISFHSGFIEKIEVRGKIDDVDITFVNKYAMGVSSISNIRGFRKMKLHSLYSYDIQTNPNQTTPTPNFTTGKNFTITNENKSEKVNKGYRVDSEADVSAERPFVYVNDIINYQRIVAIHANDISPAKQTILLDKNQKTSDLYKEESTKILEAIVYTDLLGTLEEENPNGIIQTEIAKRFNINTTRRGLFSGGAGVFEYIDAKILLSKIEKNNKFLLAEDNVFDNLKLYQYRNFSAGGSLNLISYENQDLKLNAFLETGIEFSRSGFKFSESEKGENVNSLGWTSQVKFHFFPEKRYGIQVSDKLSYFEILSDQVNLLNTLNSKNNWINTIEFKANFNISTSSKLFIRYNIVHDLENINNNFSQFQLGTSFFILEKNR